MKPAGLRWPKGETRKRVKGRSTRQEQKVAGNVRALCVERDGYCRLYRLGGCEGPSEWAHLKARAHTRGQAPEERHSTAESLMGCRKHHQQIDGRRAPRVYVDPLTDKGANGRLQFESNGNIYVEPA